MSLFFRSAPAERSIDSLPWVSGGPKPSSKSLESSLRLVPVFAACRLISDSIASLPLKAYRRNGEERIPIPLPRVLEKPGSYGTRLDWVQRALMSLLLRGNAYGLKSGYDPETQGYASIDWLDPTKVCWRDGEWLFENRPVPVGQMLHVPGLVIPGEREGISPMGAAKTAVEGGISAQSFAKDWFKNRALPGVVFKNNEQDLDPTAAAVAKDRVTATLRTGEPFVIGKKWSLDALKLSADEAGFVQAARLTATQIATIYGIPPEMIGGETAGSLTYSTVELNQIQFLTNTLRPWITRLETAFSEILPAPRYVRFNTDAMLRPDTKTRWEVNQIRRNIGAANIDEIRAQEDEPPLPNGQGQDFTPLAAKAAAAPAQREGQA